jgi:PAS domain S-box-containing protein
MKLRTILLVLSLLAVASASTGGYLYYASLKESVFLEAERQAAMRVNTLRKSIASYLTENIKPVRALARMDAMSKVLGHAGEEAVRRANRILDLFQRALEVDVCYLMDRQGETVASSNRGAPDSFVGKNFAFRPYFQHAIRGDAATYLALGVTSNKRGIYYSYPVYENSGGPEIGVVVIKASIELIEKELALSPDEIVLVSDPHGIVFISNRREWLYRSIKPLTPDEIDAIAGSRQFGPGPFRWTGLKVNASGTASDADGHRYLLHQVGIDDSYPAWKLTHLRSMSAIAKALSTPILRTTGPVVLGLCGIIGFSVFLLYRKASGEILQRRAAEEALRESETRYRCLYHNTPAMLHSIDRGGNLVSVSEYWSEVMGYRREEVIGQRLTALMTEESRRYAETVVFPRFFQSGFCQDIPYQFVTKNGRVIDILLSAIVDRDSDGNIVRSLAVSMDVTERKRAEEALRLAKEELSRYSKNLERQVRKRTAEITGILAYTPAVIYIKDVNGRYTLVNKRYEEIFGLENEAVRGRLDYEFLPAEVARQFSESDGKVLADRCAHQEEELIRHADGLHTYLAVKFPIYDDQGLITGVCGILNDITALKKAQIQLRRLSGSIMDSQEKERSALARELHDELGQVLTALRMDSVWLNERLKRTEPAAAQRALTMCQLIDREIEEVRSMAFRLRPGVLDDLGLVDALELYTTDFERRTDTSCVFKHSEVPDLADHVATAAYRITQEALTNVARHSEAARVDVVLEADRKRLFLTVTDDGRGFDAQNLAESEGLGIAGMRERAALVGGTLEVFSKPAAGARVLLTVPLDGQEGTV